MANEPTCKHCGGRIQNVQNRLVHVATGFRRCAGDRGVAEPEMVNEPKVSRQLAERIYDNVLATHMVANDPAEQPKADAATELMRFMLVDHITAEIEAACSQPVAPGPDVAHIAAALRQAYVVGHWEGGQLQPASVQDLKSFIGSLMAAPPQVSAPRLDLHTKAMDLCNKLDIHDADKRASVVLALHEAGAVSAPRCPSVEQLARVIYERQFDVRWAETQGIERALYLEVAEEVIRQFFQPVSQPSPVCTCTTIPAHGTHWSDCPFAGDPYLLPQFGCAARKAGTAGGNYPQDCDWPGCGCDEKASRVVEALIESGWQSPQEIRSAAKKLTDKDLLIAGFAYRCAEKGDNIQQMEYLLRKQFEPAQPSPGGGSKP